MFRYIELNGNGIVISVIEANSEIKNSNYLQSEVGQVGQKYVDGKFVSVPVVPTQPVETMEQKITRLEQQVQSDNFIILEVLAEIYAAATGGTE